MVFVGDYVFSEGGISELAYRCDSKEAAMEFLNGHAKGEWAQIFDCERAIVSKFFRSGSSWTLSGTEIWNS